MFIDKNQLVMPWTIPAYYGYDDGLKLIVEPNEQIPLKDVRPFKGGCNVQQLTNNAVQFLCKTFDQFANDDGLLVSQFSWKKITHSLTKWHNGYSYSYLHSAVAA